MAAYKGFKNNVVYETQCIIDELDTYIIVV